MAAMAEQKNGPDSLQSSSKEQELTQKTASNSAKAFASFAGPRKAPPRRPSAEEMIEYYRRKGLDKQAAAEKVIDDLQKALTIAVRRNHEMEKVVRSTPGEMDSLKSEVSVVRRNVDALSGPVFISAGVAAGVAVGNVLQAAPHVFRAVSQIGKSLKDAMSSRD